MFSPNPGLRPPPMHFVPALGKDGFVSIDAASEGHARASDGWQEGRTEQREARGREEDGRKGKRYSPVRKPLDAVRNGFGTPNG